MEDLIIMERIKHYNVIEYQFYFNIFQAYIKFDYFYNCCIKLHYKYSEK